MDEMEELSVQSGKSCLKWKGSNNRQEKNIKALVLDLVQAFERVSLSVVWAWATHFNFPRKILVLDDEDESGTRLCTCWSRIFESRTEDDRHHAYEIILEFVQKAPEGLTSNSLMIATKNESALGPDGTPYVFTDVLVDWVPTSCSTHLDLWWKVVLFPLFCCEQLQAHDHGDLLWPASVVSIQPSDLSSPDK